MAAQQMTDHKDDTDEFIDDLLHALDEQQRERVERAQCDLCKRTDLKLCNGYCHPCRTERLNNY